MKIRIMVLISMLLCWDTVSAEGLRSGRIYIQPLVLEKNDDTPEVRQRIAADLLFAKHIYSQIGIEVVQLPIEALHENISRPILALPESEPVPEPAPAPKSKSTDVERKNSRYVVFADRNKLKDRTRVHRVDNVFAIPVYYTPPLVPNSRERYQSDIDFWKSAPHGNTTLAGCFISLWSPAVQEHPEVRRDSMAHEVLHYLLAPDYAFDADKLKNADAFPGNSVAAFFFGWDRGHVAYTTHLLCDGARRRTLKKLSDAAPTGTLARIRNLDITVAGKRTTLFDRVFGRKDLVKVEWATSCNATIASERKLFDYPKWLRKPAFPPLYVERVRGAGVLRFNPPHESGNVAKSATSRPVPVKLEYVDQSQRHLNKNGSPLGGKVNYRDPIAYSKHVTKVSAKVELEKTSNFMKGKADAVLKVEVVFDPPIFEKLYPVLPTNIDGEDHAFENSDLHGVTITLSGLKIAFPHDARPESCRIRKLENATQIALPEVPRAGRLSVAMRSRAEILKVSCKPIGGEPRMTISIRIGQLAKTVDSQSGMYRFEIPLGLACDFDRLD